MGFDEPLVGNDQGALGGGEVGQAEVRLADHGVVAHQGQELLGRGGAAGGPEIGCRKPPAMMTAWSMG